MTWETNMRNKKQYDSLLCHHHLSSHSLDIVFIVCLFADDLGTANPESLVATSPMSPVPSIIYIYIVYICNTIYYKVNIATKSAELRTEPSHQPLGKNFLITRPSTSSPTFKSSRGVLHLLVNLHWVHTKLITLSNPNTKMLKRPSHHTWLWPDLHILLYLGDSLNPQQLILTSCTANMHRSCCWRRSSHTVKNTKVHARHSSWYQ